MSSDENAQGISVDQEIIIYYSLLCRRKAGLNIEIYAFYHEQNIYMHL